MDPKRTTGQRVAMRSLAMALGLIALVLLVLPGLVRWGTVRVLDLGYSGSTGATKLLGHVESGQFTDLNPYTAMGGFVGITTMAMQEARPPESAPLDLAPYERHMVVLAGHDGGGWLYEARVEQDLGDGLAAAIAQWAWRR